MREMLRYITKKLWLLGLICPLGFAACSDDPETGGTTQRQTLTVIPYFSSFFEVDKMYTRALPDGYQPYSSLIPASSSSHAKIGLILTPRYTTSSHSISYDNGEWTGTIDIDNSQYYFYGFMPKEAADVATVETLDGDDDYSKGVIMSINNLETLSSADVCVIVGVKRSETPQDIRNVGIQLGQFGYHGGTNNYVYLLLKHLYAGLHFKVHIDSEYAKLRKIVVRQMKLKTLENIHETINLTVRLDANDEGSDPVTSIEYENAQGSSISMPEIQLFPNEDTGNEYELPVETPRNFLGCFAPGKCTKFQLYSKYDVYDSKGNLIRKDCEAYNNFDATNWYGINSLKAGDIYTIDLKVQPTYLYVLSDPDLDNPTFTAVVE